MGAAPRHRLIIAMCAVLGLALAGIPAAAAGDASTSSGRPAADCAAPADARCWRVSPSQTLHHATRWDSPHYAMRSDSPSVARLVVFLHGYTGTASAFYAGDVTPGTSIMASAVNSGYYAIALTHRGTPNVRVECGADMSCHLPTRATLVTGTVQEGSAPAVADMAYDDGIEPRLVHLLVDLRDRTDAAGGWGAFLAPPACRGPRACTVVWSRVLLAGHSQGGGHAAVMARQHAVAGVIMLASPTDHHRGRAATSYPAYTLPAGLSTPAGGRRWKGLIHAGDPFLAAATSQWGADRLDADAVVVTSRDPRCAGVSAHGCVIGWDGLYPEWLRLWWNRADARPERVTGAPTHATLGSSRLLLARIGTRLHYAVWDGAGWEPYVPVANDGLPAGVTPADGAPAAATLDGMDFVAIRGSDDRVYLTRRPSRPAAFGDWSPIDLGGPTTQAPALVAYRGSLYAFAAGAGGLWYATSVDGVGWAAPSRIADPGTVLGGTAAIVAGGELHVYARTLDARGHPSLLGVTSSDGRKFGGVAVLGSGEVLGTPGLATDGTRVWMAVRTAGNHISWSVRDASGRWLTLRRLTSEPVLGDASTSLHRDADGLLTVYSRGPAGVIQQHGLALAPGPG